MKQDHLHKDDLARMGQDYFEALDNPTLVKVACRLHETAVELWERVNQDSRNSSRPPSTDNPYKSLREEDKIEESDVDDGSASDKKREKGKPGIRKQGL